MLQDRDAARYETSLGELLSQEAFVQIRQI